jgi:hypothetical protein
VGANLAVNTDAPHARLRPRGGSPVTLVRLGLDVSCVLRISAQHLADRVSRLSLKPYRMERGTAHFDVSAANFDDFTRQVSEAIAFLRTNARELKSLMSEPDASGVLDFAVERRDVGAQFDAFPAILVREAASLGLALEMSRYPAADKYGEEASYLDPARSTTVNDNAGVDRAGRDDAGEA